MDGKIRKIAFKQYVEFSIKSLKVIACWPETHPSTIYLVYSVIYATLIIVDTLTCAVALSTDIDYETAVFTLCLLLAHINGMAKIAFMRLKKDKLFKLMKFFDNPLFTVDAEDVTEDMIMPVRLSNIFRRLLLFFMMGTAIFVILNGFFEGGTIFLLPFDIHQQPIVVYIGISIFQFFGANALAAVISVFDGFCIMLMGIAITQLQILRFKITNAFDRHSCASVTPEMYNRNVNDTLKKCVVHHIVIEEYVCAMEDMFNIPFLIQMVLSLIESVFIIFCLFVTSMENSFLIMKLLFYFVSVILEISIFCVPGDEITRKSSDIGDACYISEWSDCDGSVRQTLFLIMERAKRPLRLTAGKFIYLSLQTLISILKSSFSYFTVLRNMYSK